MPPKAKVPDFSQLKLTPLTLLKGDEDYFVQAALARLRSLATAHNPEVEVISVDAATYEANMLQVWTSPSLFDEPRHLEIDAVEAGTEAFFTDMVTFLSESDLSDDVTIVLTHRKGNRGKRLLDVIKAAKHQTVDCQPLKREGDKVTFASTLFKNAKREISPDALTALVRATGSELAELASACQQLIADTQTRITPEVVETYYGGRVETTGFNVADAAIAGQVSKAVTLLRHAFATGIDPVVLVAVLASKLRVLALTTINAIDYLPPWQQQRARREARGWSETGLARAIRAVAEADAAVKGESRNPEYAVEKAILIITQARGH